MTELFSFSFLEQANGKRLPIMDLVFWTDKQEVSA